MKRIWVLLVITCAFAGSDAWAQQGQSSNKPNAPVVNPLVLYDNFNGRWIDPAKWNGEMGTANSLELVRELWPSYQGEGNNRYLHMFERAYASEGTEEVDYDGVGIRFKNPASIHEISFDVIVSSASVSGCQDNPNTGALQAEFWGSFFSYQGMDVWATISLVRDGTDARAPLRADALFNSDDWSIADYQTLGYVRLGVPAKLRVKWDQANSQFIFQLNGGPPVIMAYGSAIPNTDPPNTQIKGLSVFQAIPRCPSTTRGSGVMDAYFDNVYVNAP
jgi:hypothetical protein